MMMRSALF